MYRKLIFLYLFPFILSCAKNKVVDSSTSSLSFGTDETLDIITWNIENFPKQDNTTLDYLAELIDSLNVDIIAMQEIGSEPDFLNLLNKLEGWEGDRTSSTYGLAYLYKSELVINDLSQVAELDNYNLSRTPYMLELIWHEQNIYIINNHYKCCGNGTIENIYNDEEYRRQQACIMTKNYIDMFLENENVILLGDFNDELIDPDSSNVFDIFINDGGNYQFVDMGIANGISTNWSYPSWPSHLDHILITNELFDEFENEGSTVQTIRLEEYFDNSWREYEKYISDHRPVGLRLRFSQ